MQRIAIVSDLHLGPSPEFRVDDLYGDEVFPPFLHDPLLASGEGDQVDLVFLRDTFDLWQTAIDSADWSPAWRAFRSSGRASGPTSWRCSATLGARSPSPWCSGANTCPTGRREPLDPAVYRHVVFGHTHAPGECGLKNGACYLNTGTWAGRATRRLPLFIGEYIGQTVRAAMTVVVDGRIQERKVT